MNDTQTRPPQKSEPDFTENRVSHRFVFITFLIYTLLYESLIIGGFGYIVFILGYSGWWWVLAALFSNGQYRPSEWYCLLNGTPKPKE